MEAEAIATHGHRTGGEWGALSIAGANSPSLGAALLAQSGCFPRQLLVSAFKIGQPRSDRRIPITRAPALLLPFVPGVTPQGLRSLPSVHCRLPRFCKPRSIHQATFACTEVASGARGPRYLNAPQKGPRSCVGNIWLFCTEYLQAGRFRNRQVKYWKSFLSSLKHVPLPSRVSCTNVQGTSVCRSDMRV